MAIVRAVKSGNWSDTTVWNTGALPTSADDVYSNTYTVTIDTSPTVLSVRNSSATGVTAGGTFTPNNNITVTCTGSGIVVAAGGVTSPALTSNLTTGQSCTIQGNIVGAGAIFPAVRNNSTGTLNIIGNCSGGSNGGGGTSPGVDNASTGTINITGTASAGGFNGPAVVNTAGGTVNITGSVLGGSNANAYGVSNLAAGTVNITGDCTASTGPAVYSQASGTVVVTGQIIASTANAGLYSINATAVNILTGPFLASANGVNPVYALRWLWANSNVTPTYYQIRSANLAVIRPLYTADSVGGNPATSDVRSGTVYGPNNELTGTCAVPGASSVLSGVPVDATTGTATISAADIRSAIGLASANLDTQLAAIPTTAAPAASTVAAAVWAVLTSSLSSAGTIGKLLTDNINATIGSRSTYDGSDTSGTTTLLSRLTSGRAGNLDNLDATISSRPVLADIVAGVWAAATRTLTTAIDNSATIAAAVWAYASGRTITGGTVDTLTNAPSVPSADTIASRVWATADKAGYSLTEAERTAIATAVQAGILNESDGQAILNAIVGAIGNTNVDQVALVAAIRADLERSGGTLATRLGASAYTAAPAPATVATAVRSELATELARLANAATTQEVADVVQGALTLET